MGNYYGKFYDFDMIIKYLEVNMSVISKLKDQQNKDFYINYLILSIQTL